MDGISFRKVGHACFLATYQGKSILFDPWFGTPLNHGTFHSGIKMVPPTPEEMASLVAVHISHIHDDHFDKTSLLKIPKSTPILIARYVNPKFKEAISSLGFSNVVELEPWTRGFKVGPFELTVFPKEPADGTFDSSAVLSIRDLNYYVANDCIHFDAVYNFIAHMFGPFEGAFVGYAAINPKVWCTDYSECENLSVPLTIQQTTRERQNQVWEHFVRCVKRLNPKWVHPYASDYRFLNKDLAHHNETFYEADEMFDLDLGATKPLILNAGDTLNGTDDGKIGDRSRFRPIQILDSMLLPNWIDTACPEPDLLKTYEAARRFFFELISKQCGSWKKPMTVQVGVHHGAEGKNLFFQFDGRTLKDESDTVTDHKPNLILEYPAAVLSEMFKGRWTFRAIHSLFMFKARWRKLVFGQTNIMGWS